MFLCAYRVRCRIQWVVQVITVSQCPRTCRGRPSRSLDRRRLCGFPIMRSIVVWVATRSSGLEGASITAGTNRHVRIVSESLYSRTSVIRNIHHPKCVLIHPIFYCPNGSAPFLIRDQAQSSLNSSFNSLQNKLNRTHADFSRSINY